MASAKSRLLLLLGACGLLAVVAFVATVLLLGAAVKKTVNTFAPRLTGTIVTLDHARISPLTGHGTLEGLFVGNPKGWTGPKLAELGRIHLDLAPTSLLGDTITIRHLTIEQPEFVYETRLIRSNLGDLVKNIEEATGGGTRSPPSPDTPAPAAGPAKRICIQHFELRDAQVALLAAGATVQVPLPDLVLTDLGTPENGLTPGELTLAITRQILAQIATAATRAVADGRLNLDSAKGAVDKVGDALKGLLGGPRETKPKD